MAGWLGAKRSKLADEMCLIGIAMREREIRPRNRWSHGRLLPGARKSRQPFEALRCDPHCGEKPSMQLAGRHVKSPRKRDDGRLLPGRQQPIDGVDDRAIRAALVTQVLHEHRLEPGARALGV